VKSFAKFNMSKPCNTTAREWNFIYLFMFYPGGFGTRKAEVLNSLIMKITANENDTNDILQTFR